MDGNPATEFTDVSAGTRRGKVILLCGVGALALGIIGIVIMFLAVSHGVHLGASMLPLVFICVLLVAAGYFAIRYQVSRPILLSGKPASVGAHDDAKYRRFNDALTALSLRVGREAPRLMVVETPWPACYPMSFTSGSVVAVSPSMLAADLQPYEVEAVMAFALAPSLTTYRPAPTAWTDYFPLQRGQLLAEQNEYIKADDYAVGLTGQPDAMMGAITKVSVLMEGVRVRPRALVGALPFSDPRAEARKQFDAARLENLEGLRIGARQPHQFVREGQPVTEPDKWK